MAAYALAGRATVAHCDVLIAVWDGLPKRGAGGTAEIVEVALRRGVPVIHVPLIAAAPVRLLWSAHEPHLAPTQIDEIVARPLDATGYDALVAALLAPPAGSVEAAHLAAFRAETARRFTPRIEYPLLLALTGVRWLRRSALILAPFAMRASGTAIWPAAFAWSDGLAAHFAQNYRSGHVFNFTAGALAVVLGLSGLLMPETKLWLAFTELSVIGALIVNTRVAVSRNWHRRWLDYRQLAERLRPMPSLAALGVAAPDRRPASRRTAGWVD